MGQDWYADVLEFTRKLAPNRIGSLPACPGRESRDLVRRLIREEWHEADEAMQKGDLPGVADGLADLIYVSLHAAISYGIDLRPVWDAVQVANMAKEGGPTREDGKILKPEGWQPPDVAGILARQFSLSGGSTGGVGVSLGNGCTFALFQGPGTAFIKLDLRQFGNWGKQFAGYKHDAFELKPSMGEVLDAASKEIGRPIKIQRTKTEGVTLIAFFEPIVPVPDPTPAPAFDREAMTAFLCRRGVSPAEAEAMTEAQAIARMWAILETEVNPDAAESKAKAVMADEPAAPCHCGTCEAVVNGDPHEGFWLDDDEIPTAIDNEVS